MNSIKAKITASIISAAIIPLFVILIFHNKQMKSYQDEVKTEMLDSASLISNAVNNYAKERVNELEVLIANIDQIAIFNTSEEIEKQYIQQQIDSLSEVSGSYRFICVEDRFGRMHAFSGRTSEGVLVSDINSVGKCNPKWFLKYNRVSITGDKNIVTVYQPGHLTLLPHLVDQYVFPVSVELNKGTQSKGVRVSAYIEMEAFHRIVGEGIKSLKAMGVEEVGASLLDSRGALIYSQGHRNAPIENGRTLITDRIIDRLVTEVKDNAETLPTSGWMFSDIEGYKGEQLVNYFKVAEADDRLNLKWTVLLYQSKTGLLSFVNDSYYLFSIVASLVILGAVFSGLMIGGYITSPLRSLARGMDLFRHGVIDSENYDQYRDDEVGRLAKAFSLMRTYQVQRTEIMEKYVQQFQELKYAQDQANNLLKGSPDAMLIVDEDGLIVSSNPAADQLFRYKEGELEGQPVEILIPKRIEKHDDLRKTYFDKPSYRPMGKTKDLVALRKDGIEFHVSISLSPVESYQGRRVTAIIRDETRRIQYESELRKLAAVAENTNNLVIVTDRWGKIEWVNLAFEDRTGYLLHEIRGKKPSEILQGPGTDENAIKQMRKAIQAGEPIRIEVLNYTKSREPIWLDMNIQPVKGERGIENYISIESDITDRRRLEEDLLQANINLELRVKERTQQLELALERADAAAKAKSAFLATMSHEIRTPMNGVIGMLELVQRSPLSSQQKKMLHTIKVSSNTLLAIIDDILDYSKIEAGKMELSPVNVSVHDIVAEVSESLGSLASTKNITLISDSEPGLPGVIADPVRLRQVLFNLLGNAIKFTPEKGCVVVTVKRKEFISDKIYLEFSVEDTGIGIEKSVQKELFHAFRQADESTTRKYGGTGLGLSICSKIIELMGGSIEVDSEPGRGSIFNVYIPFEYSERSVCGGYSVKGKNIALIIENEYIRRHLTEVLEKSEANVISVDTMRDLEYLIDEEERFINAVVSDLGASDAGYQVENINRINLSSYDGKIIFIRPAEDQTSFPGSVKTVETPFSINRIMELLQDNGSVEDIDKSVDLLEDEVIDHVESVAFRDVKILVAEDNDINQELIQMQLSQVGIKPVIVSDGVEALEYMARENIDLLLTDCHMPNLDGFELTRVIRQYESENDADRLPIIALTADVFDESKNLCIEAGMDGYLTKPVKINRLIEVIKNYLPHEVNNKIEKESANSNIQGEKCVDVIDLSVLEDLVGNDELVIKKFLTRFIETTDPDIEKLVLSERVGDYNEAKSIAHKLKSSGRSIGAKRFASLCQEIEKESSSGDAGKVQELLGKLNDEYKQCVIKINMVVAE